MTILIDDQTLPDSFDWWPRRMAHGERSWFRTLSGVSADSGPMGAKLIAVSTERRQRVGHADHRPRPRRALHPASPLDLRRR
ncbi:hypothetical protein [Amycolatopsis sp. NPDC004169]|uniref:hypothetical protein n=1 Tax=Amycolatopsis sp. NPDC004169 TaxID=3154453 RepID=UPI0033B4DF14